MDPKEPDKAAQYTRPGPDAVCIALSLSLKITEPDTVVSEKTNQLLGVRGLPSVHLQLCLPPSSKSKGSNPIPAAACGRNVKGDQVASSPALPSLPPSLTTFFSNERQELWTVLSARHFLQLLATCAASHGFSLSCWLRDHGNGN